MKCPVCGGEMHPDNVQGWVFGRQLIVLVYVCKDDDCRFVVIKEWLWKPRLQERTP